MNIYIARPHKSDIEEIKSLFEIVINDTFIQDGIGDDKRGIKEEVRKQLSFLDKDLKSSGNEFFFLVAKFDNKIIGVIAYSKAENNKFIKENLKINLKNIPEITSAYVLPQYQGKGIGSLLFNTILITLIHKNVTHVCLDGGYQESIKFWTKRIGVPDVISKNHFGKGLNYVIWHRNINDLQIKFKL